MKRYFLILSIISLAIANHFNVEIEETGESTLFIFQNSITTLDVGDELGVFDATGIDNNGDGKIDENIDGPIDQWADGYDNDGNIYIDTFSELYTNDAGSNFNPNWSHNIENNNINSLIQEYNEKVLKLENLVSSGGG